MHNPEGLGAGDFIDWEAVRKTEEYRKHMVSFLKARLEEIAHSPDYIERLHRALEAPQKPLEDFDSLEDFMDASQENEFRTEEEQDADAEIFALTTIGEIEAYVDENKIDFDVQEEIRKLEGTYLEDQRQLAALKEKHHGLLSKALELMTGEKSKDPDAQ